jgi:hypothetical protein
MDMYAELLAQRPRSNSIATESIWGLFVDAGLVRTGQIDSAAIDTLASEIGVPPHVIQGWVGGSTPASWRDLSSLALALDKHPEFVRRLPGERGARGPWFVTRAAVADYMNITAGRLDYDDARDELAQIAQDTVQSTRIPRSADDGSLIYRGPKPLRLALVVKPATEPGALPALIAVRPTHDGIHVTIEHGSTEGYGEEDYRSWLGAWLCRRYNANTSVGIGNEAIIFGVDLITMETAWREYKEEARNELAEAATFLVNAVASWRASGSSRNANEARVAALRILQYRKIHPGILHLGLGEESALRALAESGNVTDLDPILRQFHGDLFVCGMRVLKLASRN